MECSRCSEPIIPGDERTFHSEILCEDCYMDALSPAKSCDPWAVYLATRTGTKDPSIKTDLTELQKQILRFIEEAGTITPDDLFGKLEGQVKMPDFKNALATLRHMEKIRGENIKGRVVLKLW